MLENVTDMTTTGTVGAPESRPDAVAMLDAHGDYLYRYAVSRVGNESTAEDLVQETFLAAMTGKGHQERSSERTWLTSILKHKVIDHYRKSVREVQFDLAEDEDTGFFREDGHWTAEAAPRLWDRDPAEALEALEFRRALRRSISMLPPRSAAVFVLREIEGLSTSEICSYLEISDSNLWVLLHRARLQLRSLLEQNWFITKDQTPV